MIVCSIHQAHHCISDTLNLQLHSRLQDMDATLSRTSERFTKDDKLSKLLYAFISTM